MRIALNLKGVEYSQIPVNLVSGEQQSESYLDINPQGLVPSLKLPDGSVITQSTAIIEWLEEKFPEPGLYPADPFGRARARSLSNVIACDIHPLNNPRVLKYLTGDLGIGEEQKMAWYLHWIAEGFSSLETQLDDGPYSLGNMVSMADVYLVPQVYNALRFEQDMTDYPKILAVYQECNRLDAFELAEPNNQLDAR